MILNYAGEDPIHVIGTGVAAYEIKAWLQSDTTNEILLIDPSTAADLPKGSHCMLGFVNLDYRKKFINTHDIKKYNWPIFVHPTAWVHDTTLLSPGTVLYPMCQVAYQVFAGEFLIVTPMATIGHGANLGQNVVLCPGVVIGGSAKVGDNILFGQQTNIKDKIEIASDTKFAMSSVVTRDITESGDYYGNKRINAQF